MITQPVVIRNYFSPIEQFSELLIVYEGRVYAPKEGLLQIHGEFAADGCGGLIAAAMAGNQRCGYINARCEWVIPPELDDARSFSEEGLARFCENGVWGYLNVAGNRVIAPQYAEAQAFHHGLAAVLVAPNHWRYIDCEGRFAFDGSYFHADAFSAVGLAAARAARTDPVGYIDRQGKWAIAPQFTSRRGFSRDGVAPASTDDDTYGLIDIRGQWVLRPCHRDIGEFNEDGYAHFDAADSCYCESGFLDQRGFTVIEAQRGLREAMVCGIVAGGYTGNQYLRPTGDLPISEVFSWGSEFNEFGFAVARTRDRRYAESGTIDLDPKWGILRTDGSFVAAAAQLLEPVTDPDGWLVGEEANTPLVAFLAKDGSIALLDWDAGITFQLRTESEGTREYALLHDARGRLLWRGEPHEALRRVPSFFAQPIEKHLDQLDSIDHIIALATSLLRETEARLHRYAAGQSVADDEDQLDDDEGHAKEDADAVSSLRIRRRMIRAYVSEEHNGYYDFLSDLQGRAVSSAHQQLLAALKSHFGEGELDPQFAGEAAEPGVVAWPVRLAKPVSHADDALAEENQLWLGLISHADCGDGDAWHEIWLVCVPDACAFEAAQDARASTLCDQEEDESEDESEDQDSDEENNPDDPQSQSDYDYWLAEVRNSSWALADVPIELVDDALVDAAIEADPSALSHVPARWQTGSRLESLIRQACDIAQNIPPHCMTSEGLALARSLYGEDPDWIRRDDPYSRIPKKWDQDSLAEVWGGLLSEADCIRALQAGSSLRDVPDWLRSQEVEAAALKADIYNISYIASEKITPALAKRAVQHSYGKLIEHLPEALLTSELCLTSVKVNGLSLEFVPERFKSVEVCAAALLDRAEAFFAVPAEREEEACTRLIEQDLASARAEGDRRSGSRWHGLRAWSRLWRTDYLGAIADATLAIEHVRYPAHAYYVRAYSCRELGRIQEAALNAAIVLALWSEYREEFDGEADTSWLKNVIESAFRSFDANAMLGVLKDYPLSLSSIPKRRITRAMVDVAVAASPVAVEFVPRQMMTPQLYEIAVRNNFKSFVQVPPSMLTEGLCIYAVSEGGASLEKIPSAWRTLAVCVAALNESASAIRDIPDALKAQARKAVGAMQA